jgi:hypothetical protein
MQILYISDLLHAPDALEDNTTKFFCAVFFWDCGRWTFYEILPK